MSVTSKLVTLGAAGASTEPEGAWDLSYAYYTGPFTGDIANNKYVQSFSVASQEGIGEGVFFKTDGTKMYVVGRQSDSVHEYDLSTAWDISSASFLQSFSVASQDGSPMDLFFKPDGTKMYVVGDDGNDVNEYNLSFAWDVSSASYLQNFSVSAQDTQPNGLFFKTDGTKMYVVGTTGQDINEYDLSSAWDVSTASYLQRKLVSSQDSIPTSVSFMSDGTKMYVLGNNNDRLYQYNLSTPWDISTASYITFLSLSSRDTEVRGLYVKPDGSGFYMLGYNTDAVYQYDLGGFSVSAQETAPAGLFFKPDGTKMYIIGFAGDDVNEYDLSVAWDISTASYVQNFSVATQETNPYGIAFKSDGTKMYVVGLSGVDVNEYDLSTPWDVSTASYVQNFSVAAQEASPVGIAFKSDGAKMYIIGLTGVDVNEYDLSTPWDVSTASYVQNFSVSSQEATPLDLFFKPNGTKMYVIGVAGDDVNEYDLSTPWDVSTASYLQNFSVATQDATPYSLFFKDDGTQMFMVGTTTDKVYSYTIGPQP